MARDLPEYVVVVVGKRTSQIARRVSPEALQDEAVYELEPRKFRWIAAAVDELAIREGRFPPSEVDAA